jgi:hypothetical protein
LCHATKAATASFIYRHYTNRLRSGGDVIITFFSAIFDNFLRNAFFSKTNVMINFLYDLAFESKTPIFRHFLGENI